LKCKGLRIEIQRKWNVKTRVIPIIIRATGTISKSFRKYVSTIPGNNEVKELQKSVILGTAHILRKVRQAGINYVGAINSSDRIASTLYSLETWFVSGIYV
jgi:hypothetical protein